MWNGTAPSLNARPATTNTVPRTSTDLLIWPVPIALNTSADVERAGGAVHHRQAVEQEAARQGAEDEVLHRRLGGQDVVAAHRHQGVEAQRHQLEAEIDDQEVVRRDHHQDAEQGEHREREQLALQHLALGGVGPGVDQRHHHRQGGEQAEQVAHRVGHHHALHRVEGEAVGEVPELQHRQQEQRRLRQRVGDGPLRVLHPQVDERDQAGGGEQQDLGVDGLPVHGVRRHGAILLIVVWRSSCATEACITSVNGFG